MKKQLLCLPCTVRAAYDIAVRATDNESLRHEIVAKTIRWLSEQADMSEGNPTVFHYHVFKLAQKITGNMDPFKPLKKASNDIAMRFLPLQAPSAADA